MSEWSEEWATGVYTIRDSSGIFSQQSGNLGTASSPQTQRDTYGGGLTENFDNALSNRALQKARNNLKAQKINLGQAFAERRQVSSQMLETAKTLACAGIALRHGQVAQAARCLSTNPGKVGLLKGLANQWLGLKYGWQPLLSDIHGAVLALENKRSEEWMVTVKGKAQSIQTDFRSYGNTGSINACFSDHRVFKGCYVRIDAVPASSALAKAAELGLTNPAALAWELLPFSFVADWFVPIGDYLEQFDSCAGWDIRGFSQSDLVRAEWKWQGRSTKSGSTTYDPNWKSRRRFVALNRNAGVTVPFPVLPWIKDPFTASNVKNALALLVQAFH
jgi:hypothetical protein